MSAAPAAADTRAGGARPTVVLVAAVARNGVIGRGGDLVFRDPRDQAHFRAATIGHPVLMGRRTWASLPPRFRPLPGRENWVLSRGGAVGDGARTFAAFDAALDAAWGRPRLAVIGGAEVYAQALPHADELLLTEVDADLDGDVAFPPWPRAAFDELARHAHTAADGTPFAFVRYGRRPEPRP